MSQVVGLVSHEYFQYNFDTKVYEPTGSIEQDGLLRGDETMTPLSAGIKIGFAFTGRGKRKKRRASNSVH